LKRPWRFCIASHEGFEELSQFLLDDRRGEQYGPAIRFTKKRGCELEVLLRSYGFVAGLIHSFESSP